MDLGMITEQQIASIRKLCEILSCNEPHQLESRSYDEAKAIIAELIATYKAAHKEQ